MNWDQLRTGLLLLALLSGVLLNIAIYLEKPYCPTQVYVNEAIRTQCPCFNKGVDLSLPENVTMIMK